MPTLTDGIPVWAAIDDGVSASRPEVLVPADLHLRTGTRWRPDLAIPIEVDPDEPVRAALERTRQAIGIPPTSWDDYWPHHIAFAGQDGEMMEINCHFSADGSILWYPKEDITFREVQRLCDRKVLNAHVSQLHLVLDRPVIEGGNGYSYWAALLSLVHAVWPYIEVASTLGGLGWVGSAIRRFHNSVVRNHKELYDRHGDIARIKALFSYPRTSAEAAELLGVPSEDAGDLLRFFGLHLDDGFWRPHLHPRATELAEFAEILHTSEQSWKSSRAARYAALRQCLSYPPGMRSGAFEGLLRQLDWMQDEADYVNILPSLDDRGRMQVISWENDHEVVLGQIELTTKVEVRARDASGRVIVDLAGSPVNFREADHAARVLQERYAHDVSTASTED